jgi:transcriptional regulator with XRE-family HTH domain
MEKKSLPPKRALAGNVRRLRLEQGLSQEGLAAEASTRQALISAIEIGKANPTLDVLTRISAALRVELTDLFAAMRG